MHTLILERKAYEAYIYIYISAFSFPPTVPAEERNVERATDRGTSERLARGLVSLPSWMQAAREKMPSERTPARRQIIGSG